MKASNPMARFFEPSPQASNDGARCDNTVTLDFAAVWLALEEVEP